MGTFSAGALANIQEAARRVGINKDRIRDILGNAPAASGVLWNDGALQTIAPTYSGTAEADDNLVTVTGHNLTNGTLVRIVALTGGTGLTNGNLYYVVAADTNVFSLSATLGGAAINITVDASAISVRRVANTFLSSVIREAFRQRGLYQDQADRFIAAITALDTGLNGTITVPDLEDLRWTTAIQTLVDAGFVAGTITGSDADDVEPIGTVIATQSPAAGATAVLGDNEVDFTVQGVPDINDVTLLAALVDIEGVGLTVTGIGPAIACTVVVATDVITSADHGLANGDRVLISAIATATGFSAGDIVYVHSVTDDTFEIETEIDADDGDFGGSNGTLSVRLIDPADISYVDPDGAAVDDAIATVPAAGVYTLSDGDAVTLTLGGAEVPTWSTGGAGDGGASTPAEFAADLATAGLVGAGTSEGTGTLGAILTSDPDEGEFVALGSVVTYTYEDPA